LSNDMVAGSFRMRPLHHRMVDPLHLRRSPANIADIVNRCRGLLFERDRA